VHRAVSPAGLDSSFHAACCSLLQCCTHTGQRRPSFGMHCRAQMLALLVTKSSPTTLLGCSMDPQQLETQVSAFHSSQQTDPVHTATRHRPAQMLPYRTNRKRCTNYSLQGPLTTPMPYLTGSQCHTAIRSSDSQIEHPARVRQALACHCKNKTSLARQSQARLVRCLHPGSRFSGLKSAPTPSCSRPGLMCFAGSF
jgi:hypothetical protein